MDNQSTSLIQSVAHSDIPDDFLRAVDMKSLLQGFSADYKKMDNLKSARKDHEERNFLSRWWNKSELEDATLDAAELQASFSKKIGQLMVLSVAQSKQLVNQQEELAIQQEIIQEQTLHLATSDEKIQQQQQALSEQNLRLEKLVTEYFELKGLTQEGAIQLIKIANEIKHTKDQLIESVDQQTSEIRQSQQLLQQAQSDLINQVEHQLDKALAVHDTRWQAEITQQRVVWTHALDVQQMALNELKASTGQYQQLQAQSIESHQALLQAQAQELAQLRSDIKRTESGWQKRARWWLISTVVTGVTLITAVAYLAYRLFLMQPLV
ncbi:MULTISPECIES: hypothetical protein [unclassified Shewanella]|uniref:hypothetical protein n=1 Tax=Shewanella TaxID=22 RepID=UPI002004171C|nr:MULTISPECIES: hypothetical protein [unclassified Shewanella]MCK7628730.1 hypothetical protein [Shewanella sp. JNE9-1]MCK7643979.1 hypothetical protein [Shewanella sp. JNE3-1]MCK7652033.1 hypothetical protein [Shewanella sp. JNE4-1]UPO26059.1 hypothetical protein MZ018_14185 [Shewanella sp. JNE10-2]UPO37045.1 hypothetical protein MZ097_09125 [Shewanella sp. JNE7]